MNRLAVNLKTLLAQQGLSENELAERTGVQQPTINRILRGESKDPRDSTVEPLARYFGVSVEALRRGSSIDESSPSSGPEGAVIAASSSLRGAVAVPHAAGFDRQSGPTSMTFPEMLIRELMPLSANGRLAWVVNPTDSMGEVIPKGAIAFIDTSYQAVRGNGIYAVRLFGEPAIMRIQIRGQDELRVMGSNRFEESIDLHGDQVTSLSVGGLVVGYADRIKLIE